MRGHRTSNRLVLSAAVCLAAVVVGVTAWATWTGSRTGGPSEPAPFSSTRDLRSQDLPVIELQTAQPSDRALRTTAVVHAVSHGIELACVDLRELGANPPGSAFDATCTASSVGGFDGAATFACGATSWLACEVYPDRARVAPDEGATFGVSVSLGPLAPAGVHTLRVTARSGSLTYDTDVPFTVKATGLISALPGFVCDRWSALVHPGGAVRVPCEVLPRAYDGTVSITCFDAARCRAEPDEFVTTGRTSAMPFELVVNSPYDAQPGTVTQVVRMTGGSGQLHPFDLSVPVVTGSVDLACPLMLAIPATGTTPLHCTATSTGGFDGYVRIGGEALLPLGTVSVQPLDVRVPAGHTVDVTVPVVSSGLPLAPIALSLDLTPLAWSGGPVSIALTVGL